MAQHGADHPCLLPAATGGFGGGGVNDDAAVKPGAADKINIFEDRPLGVSTQRREVCPADKEPLVAIRKLVVVVSTGSKPLDQRSTGWAWFTQGKAKSTCHVF